MNSFVIEVRDLWFSYNGHSVLKGADFEVPEKGFVALIGPNGGGKTTLLKLMLGLLEPDRGRVRIFGETPRKTMHRIGYVPQEVGVNKSFPISVTDVVLMGRMRTGKIWPGHSQHDRIAAQEVLNRLGMSEYKDRRIGELSGGERQKVLIARAIVNDPEILFLDEPVANVDSKGQSEFYDLLKELNETATVIMVSHDLMVISSYVKSVTCVNRSVHYHDAAEITQEMADMYCCPAELVTHGEFPHRVLRKHEDF
ncbi:metal ABC transporter ATP-binding protein [Desulfococcaceae bacterium HSG8]|nr:metal ABC transporter ATP-binding protein [Desulfococcaceae bacterium HSG8]